MRASCCMLLLCLLALACPAGAEGPRPGADRILTSGPYTVRVREGNMSTGGGFARVSRNGRVLVTLREAVIYRAEIRPLLGPDSADLIVETWTGGTHYRFVLYLMHLGERLRPLLTFSIDNAVVFDFRDLDHDGRQEFITWDDSFAYFDALGLADAPFIPFVFHYEHGRYREATARFRWLVVADQEKARGELLEAVRRPIPGPEADEDKRSYEAFVREGDIRRAAVHIYAEGVLLGESKQVERWLRAHLPPENWSRFAPLRRDIRLTVLNRGHKITYRLRPAPYYTPYWMERQARARREEGV
jgi:hypothetical protein